jgi:hypothetical protein
MFVKVSEQIREAVTERVSEKTGARGSSQKIVSDGEKVLE